MTKQLEEERTDFAGAIAGMLLRSKRGSFLSRVVPPQRLHKIEMPHVAVPSVTPDTSIRSITPLRVRPFTKTQSRSIRLSTSKEELKTNSDRACSEPQVPVNHRSGSQFYLNME